MKKAASSEQLTLGPCLYTVSGGFSFANESQYQHRPINTVIFKSIPPNL